MTYHTILHMIYSFRMLCFTDFMENQSPNVTIFPDEKPQKTSIIVGPLGFDLKQVTLRDKLLSPQFTVKQSLLHIYCVDVQQLSL